MNAIIRAEVEKLSPAEREVLIDEMIALDDNDDVSPELQAELERRFAAFRQNPASAVSADTFFARLRTRNAA